MKIAYCTFCKEEVKPIKKPMNTLEKTLWFLLIVITVGIGSIAYILYRFRIVKKKFCPKCFTAVRFQDKKELDEKAEHLDTSTAKGKVLAKVEKVKATSKNQKVKEESFCPYCGTHVSSDILTCPSCKTSLKQKKE